MSRACPGCGTRREAHGTLAAGGAGGGAGTPGEAEGPRGWGSAGARAGTRAPAAAERARGRAPLRREREPPALREERVETVLGCLSPADKWGSVTEGNSQSERKAKGNNDSRLGS